MAIEIPSSTRAATVATNLINQLNSVVGNIGRGLSQGLPASNGPQGSNPAVEASDLAAAFGTTPLAQAHVIVAASTQTDATKLAAALAALA